MKGFCPLASGSKGNAIYVSDGKTKILIDAGISLRALTERLRAIDVDIAEIDAVLITHEHIDHVKGLPVLCKKWGIPVLSNKETAKAIMQGMMRSSKESNLFVPKFKIFSTGETFQFEQMKIHPFSIQHDAIEPVAFTVEMGNLKLGLCADLGFASSLVLQKLQKCDYLYLEANHEPSMVHSSPRPAVYKQRVLSRQGHLSNSESAEVLSNVYHPGLKHVFLAHLSSECNTPELALKTVKEELLKENKELSLSISWQDMVSDKVLF